MLLIQVNGTSDRFWPRRKDVIKLLESSGYRTAIYEPNTRTLNDTTAAGIIAMTYVLTIQSKKSSSDIEARLKNTLIPFCPND